MGTMLDELPQEEKDKITKILEGTKELDVKVLHEWYDDHQPCATILLNDEIEFELWWIDVSPFNYPDSMKAQDDIRKILKERLED